MPIATYVFNEVSPAAPGTSFSVGPISGPPANYLPPGVCGPFDDYESVEFIAELVGATGGPLDVYVQTNEREDNGDWFDVIHFPQLLAAASAIKYNAAISLFTNATAPIVIGKNASPALAANTIVQGPFGSRFRLCMVAGTSTSAGAAVKITVMGQRTRSRELWGS